MIPTVSFEDAAEIFADAPLIVVNPLLPDCDHLLYVAPVFSFSLDLICSRCFGVRKNPFSPEWAGLPFEEACQRFADEAGGTLVGAIGETR